MKNAISVMLLIFGITPAYGQSAGSPFFYRIGDEVSVCDVYGVGAGDGGDNVEWDFSGIRINGDRDEIVFTNDADTDTLVAAVKGRIRYYYRQDSTAIRLHGYESNIIKVRYDRPQTVMPLPLCLGNSREGTFHGSEMYCERLMMRQMGTYSVKVDGKGTMLLPDGVPLDSVFRVKTTICSCDIVYDRISTEGELVAYIDSVRPFPDADIVAYMATNGHKAHKSETYSWYARGYRYPILVKTVYTDGVADSKEETALYCPPDVQRLMYDPENEDIRGTLSPNTRNRFSENEFATEDNAAQACPYEINVSEDVVSVRHNASVSVSGLLSDPSGIVYRQVNGGVSSPLQINCRGLRRGEYVIYLDIDGVRYTSKVRI